MTNPTTTAPTSTPSAMLPPLIGVAPLMRRAFAGENLVAQGEALLARAQANPLDAHAFLDFSTVLQLTGNREHALAVQAEAIAIQPLYTLLPAARQTATGLRLLAIMGPGDLMANTPLEFLLGDADVSLDLLYLTATSAWPETLPEHDVMMVAVAESEASQPLLRRLAEDTADWPRPVVNRPQRIAILSRDGACAALQNLPGLEMPATVRLERTVLQAIAHGTAALTSILPDGDFPIIARPIGSHAGQHLEKLSDAADIANYLQSVPSERFYVSRFVDYHSADGAYRKYRIVLIEGKPFICHFAISSHWMIHYLNAGMTESAAKRAEEAACMATFDATFAMRHRAALQKVHQRIGLPYLGIDCAETASGDLLIFEIDNAMIVHDMDPDSMFAYKKPVMHKIFSAFRQLLERSRNGDLPGA